jgi:CBS domain-containing protein
MTPDDSDLARFLAALHPYDALTPEARAALLPRLRRIALPADQQIYGLGEPLEGLYLIHGGQVAVRDAAGAQLSLLGPRNSFGERGLLRDGRAASSARTTAKTLLLLLPRADLLRLIDSEPAVARFFDRQRAPRAPRSDLATSRVESLMTRNPLTCPPETPVQAAALRMREARVSSICVTQDGVLLGLATLRDFSGKVVAGGLPPETPVAEIMSRDPISLPPSAIGSDVLHMMMERRIGHVPICEGARLVGILTQTDLTRFQATTPAGLVSEIAQAGDAAAMARVTAHIPQLLVQLVASGARPEVVTRLITDVADACTRRLLALAEATLGPAPVPWLWLACGSQGRQEQSGVSDQDNCLILDDALGPGDDAYFAAMAAFVCDGLDACGYVYCPGGMMATTPRWRQTAAVWRGYFRDWIARPRPEAQMLASVMFDLRPIAGSPGLFGSLHQDTLAAAARNSIFVAHMVGNALKHSPPLGLWRGLATIRSGEHRNHIDMKLNGVVPVVDLARIYALRGQLLPVNSRARLQAAMAAGGLSASGGRDLLAAYDVIAETRLAHQARRVKAGLAPDNHLSPADLSDFERSHLRDAFVVVKSLQSALGHGTALLG